MYSNLLKVNLFVVLVMSVWRDCFSNTYLSWRSPDRLNDYPQPKPILHLCIRLL